MTKTTRIAVLAALALAAAGCGGSNAQPIVPTIRAARTFSLADFEPAEPAKSGRTEDLSFVIRQPSGQPLTAYRHGPGPHTGVHLIIVRDDLSTIIHRHPPIGSGGRFTQALTFPGPGRYRVVIDAYPSLSNIRNFQLFKTIQVGKGDPRGKLPPFHPVVTVDGYRFALHGGSGLRALTPSFLEVTVRDPHGRPATFTPYYGALAHAIFFAAGSLDYFHTHVCGPSTPGCTSILGAARVRGTSTAPGKLTVGVLVPLPGVWRLFLQAQVGGKVLTAPYTLKVR